MDYTSIFSPIPWEAVGHSVLQTFLLYWMVLFGIKLVGRRVFGEMGPQDFIVLLLVAESCNLGLANEEAGFWGTVFSVLTVLTTGAIAERVSLLRRFLAESAIDVLKDGRPLPGAMKRSLVEEDDLLSTAREYGMPDYSVFEKMTLESDGHITGVLKPQYRSGARQAHATKPI